MSGRLLRILILIPLLLLLVAVSGAWWFLESEKGTRWLWLRITAAVPGELGAETIDGALADGLALRGVRYVSETVEVTITSARLTATPTIFPPAVELGNVAAGEVTVRLRRAPSPDEPGTEGMTLSDVLAMLEPPVPARIGDLSLDRLRVIGHDGRQIFAMRAVRLGGDLAGRLTLEHARLAIGDIALEASGSIGLSAPNPVEATIELAIDADAAAFLDGTPVRLAATLAGDFDEIEVDVAGHSPEFRLGGAVRNATERPRWDVTLESDVFQWPLGAENPVVRARGIEIESTGGPGDYSLRGTAMVAIRDSGDLRAVAEGSGDTAGIDVADLRVSGELATAAMRGRIAWSPAFSIEALADVSRFDPHRFMPAWPADRSLVGAVDARITAGSIQLAELRMQVGNSPMTLESSGTIDPARGIVDLDIGWQGLAWPIDAREPQVQSDAGEIRLGGTPDDWQVDGRIVLGVAGYPDGDFVLHGAGDREQVALSLDQSEVLGGTAAGQLHYAWTGGGEWSASLAVNDIRTEPVLAASPGVLDASFEAEGRVRPFEIDLTLREFDGSLRGKPVAGRGGLRYAPDELRFRGLEIASGDSSLVVDGALRSAEGIDFDADIAALGTFFEAASGSFTARGNVAMQDGFPRLALEFDGRDVGWQEYRAGELSIDTVESAASPLALEVDATKVELDGRSLESLGFVLTASPDAQRIEARAATADATLEAVLDGAFDDWREPLATGWRGRLEALSVAAAPDFALELDAPAAVELAREAMALEGFCLAGDAELRICGDGHWAGARDFHVQAQLEAFPVDALELVLDTGLEFTQTVSGSLAFSRTGGSTMSGDVQLDVSAGRIRNRLDERLATTTRPGRVQLHLADGQLLSGQLRLPFSEASEVDASFEVLDVAKGQSSPVEGQLRLEINDIGIATHVAPMIDAASGRLVADVAVGGTVGEPRVTGEGSLSNGSLGYQPLGLRLEDLQLRGNMQEGNRLELEGTFSAGDGSGRLYTSADYLDGEQTGLRVSLSGRNLTVIDVPNLLVIADPELDFGLDEGTITVNGSIKVPRARFSPANLTANTVRESGDVVIVAGQETEAEQTPENGDGIAIEGEVDLTLGDDIVIDLDIADARVTGATTFRWSGPPMPVADGQYLVSGNFQAYGQLLQITEGIVNFPKVPADNPVLRIRAEREIFGNSQIRSAGVFISGTAKDPEVEVYTTPATTESRALTLLVTGSDFNYDQGVGGVDVGTYIAPDLYLSYGIGLFDRENVISLRYDFAKGFGIKASSSTRTDGIDLSYTIER